METTQNKTAGFVQKMERPTAKKGEKDRVTVPSTMK